MNNITKDELADWVVRNQTKMYHLALCIMKNETDAEDAVCEGIVRAFEHIDSLREPDRLSGWMMTIVGNTAISICRKKKHEIVVAEIPEKDYVVEEHINEIWDYVCRLAAHQKITFILFFYTGYSIKEIAEIMSVREGTVKSRLSRARESLREMLTEGGYGQY